MPGRRSISLEPEELSVASPIRRSTRIKAIHIDSPSPAHKNEERPAARRTRRSQSIQSLNDYETEQKRDESPSLKTKLTDSDKPSTPARRTKRSTSLQSEINEETKPLRRTKRTIAAKDIPAPVQEENETEEEEDKIQEVKGKPKKRVTRSMSKSPVDTKITKTSAASATRRYKLSLNKDGQETSKINALDIITENEDEPDKTKESPEKNEETIEKSTLKSLNTKRDSLNDSIKIATVVLEKIDTSLTEDKTKTDIEDNISEVPTISEENNQAEIEIFEIKEEIDIKLEIDEEETVELIEENHEINEENRDNTLQNSGDFELFLEEENENKAPEKSKNNEDKTEKESVDSDETEILEITEKEIDQISDKKSEIENADNIENPEETLNKTIDQSGNNHSITSDHDTNISLVCEKGTIENTKTEITEDESNISIVGSGSSSPRNVDTSPTQEQNISLEERDQNLSIVNDDGKSYSAISVPENSLQLDLDDSLVDDIAESPNTSKKSVRETPSPKRLNKNAVEISPITRSRAKKLLEGEINEMNTSNISIDGTPPSVKSDKTSPIKRKSLDEDELPLSKIKSLNEEKNTNGEPEEISETADVDISINSVKTSRRSKINIEVDDSPIQQSEEFDLNESSRSSKRRSNKFVEEEETNEQPENELDVSSKSVKKTPKRQSVKNENEEIKDSELDISSKSTKKSPKRNSIKNIENESTDEQLQEMEESPKKISKRKSIKNLENENADEQLQDLEEPELNISSKSAKNTPERKSIKNIDNENTDDESQETTKSELVVSSKSVKNTPKRESIKNTDDASQETTESELDVSSKSSKKIKSFKHDNENPNNQSEDTKESELNISSKSAKKTPKRKSLNTENSESSKKDKIKTPSEKNPKNSEENINDDSDQENNSPNKLKEKDEEKSRDKMLDEYLASYTAEKKRKRELDETENSITHDEKKQRKIVRGINFSESGDESDDENEDANEFLDDMASEGSEDTPSIDSNEIIDEGESIGSTESEYDSDEDDYEHGSFVVDDDVGNDLLSGDDDDHIEALEKAEKSKRRRVITISDSSDEDENDKTDLDNLSMKPYGGMSPSSSINQVSSVESDLESIKNKNEELSKQIEDGTRNTDEDDPERSVVILEDSIIETDNSKLESDKKDGDDSVCIVEEEKDTNKLEEIEHDKKSLESVEKEILEMQNEENSADSSEKEAEKIQLEEKDEKYKELLDKYFKQFDEDKKRNRRETIGESPPTQKEKLNKRDRRQSLGSQNIVEESRQRFESYCEEIKEKQAKKKRLSSDSKENVEITHKEANSELKQSKRKSLSKLNKSIDELNIVAEEIIADILKPNKKSLSPSSETETSSEVQQEIEVSTQEQPKKSKRKNSVSFEMNTSGVYLVSPIKNEDIAASKTNKRKSYSENDETADLLKDFPDITNDETNIIEVQVPKILITEALESEAMQEIKKKKKQKLDTSLNQFEELAEVEMFKTPIAYKSETLTAQQKKKLKKIKSASTEFDNLAEVSMFRSPKVNRVDHFENLSEVDIFSTPAVEKVKSPLTDEKLSKKKKKVVEKSEETQEYVELPAENVKEKKQKKKNKKQDTEIMVEPMIEKEKSPAKDETVPKKKNKIEDISEQLPTDIIKDKKKTKKNKKHETETIIPEIEVFSEKLSTTIDKAPKKKTKLEENKKLPEENVPKIEIKLSPKDEKLSKKKTKDSQKVSPRNEQPTKKKVKTEKSLKLSAATIENTKNETKKLETEQTEIISAEPEITQTAVSLEKKKRKKKKKSTSVSSDNQSESDSSVKRQKLSSVESDDSSFENKLPMKSEISKIKKIKTASVDILKVNNENNISQVKDILVFKNVPSSTEVYKSKGTVSKFMVKTAKTKPSKSEYMLYSKYFSTKANKYKNLITPSSSGWTDPTVTVMNISQASRIIRKPKKKREVSKPSFAGNVNKFNVEELVNENLVTCSSVFKLHKK